MRLIFKSQPLLQEHHSPSLGLGTSGSFFFDTHPHPDPQPPASPFFLGRKGLDHGSFQQGTPASSSRLGGSTRFLCGLAFVATRNDGVGYFLNRGRRIVKGVLFFFLGRMLVGWQERKTGTQMRLIRKGIVAFTTVRAVQCRSIVDRRSHAEYI